MLSVTICIGNENLKAIKDIYELMKSKYVKI
jgi:hypothetical protein